MGRFTRVASLATVALGTMAAGCGVLPTGTPHDSNAVFRPASMVVDAERAAPGDVVQLTFPDAMDRGIMFVLEQESGPGWVYRYLLISDANGGRPSWHDPDGEVAVEAVGIAGPGPDRVVIPGEAEPGSWRICTGNAGQNVCVRIGIARP